MVYLVYRRFLIILVFSVYNADFSEFNECSCLKGKNVDQCGETHFREVPNSHFIFPLEGVEKSWSQAKASCESLGAELAETSNYADNLAMRQAITEGGDISGKSQYWVGVVKKSSGKFSYSDGITPIAFSPKIFWDRSHECGFVSISSSSPSNIMYKMDDCLQQKKFICQYRRDSLCYVTHNSDWEGLRDTVLPDSGFFVSLQQKPWADADYDCKQHGMQLLSATEKSKKRLPELLEKLKSKHFMSEVWTSGKFMHANYKEMKWSGNDKVISNLKSGEWNPLSSTWEENEPRDKSGRGLDLCLLMNMQRENTDVTWSAENCLIPKFYICMEGLHTVKPVDIVGKRAFTGSQPELTESYMEYCDGSERIQMTMSTCSSNLLLRSTKPDCICFSGLNGVTDHDSCKSSLYSGSSCVALSTDEEVHWKILRPLPAEPFVYIQTRNIKSGNYIQWSNMMKESTRQLLGPTTIFYSGVRVFKLSKNSYCLERNDTRFDASELSTINRITTGDTIAKVFYTHKCMGQNLEEYNGATSEPATIASECSLSCSGGSSSITDDNDSGPSLQQNKPHPQKPNAESERERQKALGTLLVQDAIDSSFSDYKDNHRNSKFKPQRSFKLLEKLFEIAKHVCVNIVSEDFLKKGLDLFKVLHYGKMYEYGEYFTERETKKIEELLDKCMAQQEVAQVTIDKCTGQVTHTETTYPNGTYEVRPVDITGYGSLPQHHIPELTWNVIDIMNVACLRSFRTSYLLYHTLEQGMENLFTNEIRRLWHHPMTNADVYKQVLGSDELTNMINLRSCADSIYQRHYRVSRLERPREVVYREFKGDPTADNSTSGVDKTKLAYCSPKTQCRI